MNNKKMYFKAYNLDLDQIKLDLKNIKKFLKSKHSINYPGKFQLFKNKNTGTLYLTVTTINFDIQIINLSNKNTLKEQMQELFPEYNFFEEDSAGGFNLFPGMINTVYGYSDASNIIMGASSPILEF